METEELERLAASITPGPWKWWTSNSYKRLMQDIGRDSKPVIEPYVCKDGCPDISISQALMTAISLLPELLAEVIATRRASGPATNESAEPVAWRYEDVNPETWAWEIKISDSEPAVQRYVRRNITPLYAHPQPMTVEAAAQVLLDKWMHGEFEDDADAIAQDQIDYGGDAADVIEAWLRALAAKGGQHE